ncbi:MULTISPECIES: AAA family ATPase [Paenibacillus]|uniref:AAA domain protein n=1 Tax=Paenibacillus macerans TaxID=44252 RepID=A0A090ZHA6_PAEMA|nr:DUF3696 domain-containing protein [Paenibacillus macerans]KFN09813.1 AAA domain protein [Paenibacillus macerans]MCY7559759.1 DUF3696 domain-containing protein [Paenibacillus macerans]MEC0151168.1 DUF3696 domain-containing protein [Paenibacillus macerans]OMG51005.1 hypothetical protein BK140_03770 [Paenibacillus macerans]SUA82311.1 Uncharacterized conserved protein [Paenibacillus macerans]
MLKNWTLQHFKSVSDKTTLELAPLTVFSGANNSGKSTIIQSILLTAQTLQNPVKNKPIILNGHIVRLGSFEDIVSATATKDITIGFELHLDEPTDRASRIVFWGGRPRRRHKDTVINFNYSFTCEGDIEITNLYPLLKQCDIRVKEGNQNEELLIKHRNDYSVLEEYALSSEYLESFDEALNYEVVKQTQSTGSRRFYKNQPTNGKPIGATLEHFMPNKITLVYNIIEEDITNLLKMCTYPDSYSFYRPIDFTQYVSSKFHKLIIQCFKEIYEKSKTNYAEKRATTHQKALKKFVESPFSFDKLKRCFETLLVDDQRQYSNAILDMNTKLKESLNLNGEAEYALTNTELNELIGYSSESIINYFTNNVKYLGPLRDEPKAIYPHSGATDSHDVGYKGEYTAAVLEIHKLTKIDYIKPEDIESNNKKISNDYLLTAVLDWLQYMGVVNKVETHDRGKLGHELKVGVSEKDKWHDLTHVGVGVSQVLPILVLSLLANKGATLIFEQPELHLHPKVQTRLADFFVSMSFLNKQCIVETHSEYLINRLRYRTVVSSDENFSNSIILYFVEKEEVSSQYKPIRINKFGVIEDWPKGFFDENEESSASILKAALAKRKKEMQAKE